MPKRNSGQFINDKRNNNRAHPLGMIQVKKDSSNKIMLRSEGEISDGVGMCLEIG